MKLEALNMETYNLGHGLTLVRDRNAGDFEMGWTVIDCPLPETEDYDGWWRAVGLNIVSTDARVLAVLAEKFAGVEIRL